MTLNSTYQIKIPQEFYDSCEDNLDNYEPLTETCGDYVAFGSYDFLIAQASYFAWPNLTYETLDATITHENAHNTLTMATALGHLKLHIKAILEFTPKIPPANKLAQALRKYLGIIIESSIYTQETAATMSAYTALRISYGLAVADDYLKRLRRPSPYTKFVDPAIDLFSRHSVPYQQWGGYMMFLASLAMNTNIDELASALPGIERFEKLCARSPITADVRFEHIFEEFEDLISRDVFSAEKEKSLKRKYNHISKVISSDLSRLIADALLHQAVDFELSDYDKDVLGFVRRKPLGFPGKTDIQTIFYASQPKRKARADNYLFHMDENDCADCDLVEMGLASLYENVTYGGISINFYVANSLPMKTGFWMLHPCCALRCSELLDNKTLVVYFTRDFLNGGKLIKPVRELVSGRKVIYIFFGHYGKFMSWTSKREKNLVYTIAEMERPPVRFILLRSQRDSYSTYVLPVAPFPCKPIDDILSTIKNVTMSEFADTRLKADLEKFFTWYINAPVTC